MTEQTHTKGGKLTPPLVGLGHIHTRSGLTLEQVAEGVAAITGKQAPRVGSISGVLNGHRKPSDELLDALLQVYGLSGEPFVYPRPRLLPTPARAAA